MRAIVCSTVGSIDDLQVEDVAAPTLRSRAVRIQVHSAGLNFVDALFVQGKYQIKPATPFVPGSEVAGIVSEVADDVTTAQVGDRVVVSCGLGGFAEEIVAGIEGVAHVPAGLSLAAASTMIQSYSTALYALRDRAHIGSGQQVLVLGAGGGVGVAAVQVARALGATVVGCASTAQKRALAGRAGATTLIEAHPATLKELVREASLGGVDIVVDPIGGEMADPALRCLRDGGRYLVIGFAAGTIPLLPANQILLRNRSVLGIDWGSWAMNNPAAQHDLLGDVLAMAEGGSISPPEPTSYRFDDAAQALHDLLNRRVAGKAALSLKP
jgi:NADPH2:quinone reductase